MHREDDEGRGPRRQITTLVLFAAAALLVAGLLWGRSGITLVPVLVPTVAVAPSANSATLHLESDAVAGIAHHQAASGAPSFEIVRLESSAPAPTEPAPVEAPVAEEQAAPLGIYVVQAGDFLGRIALDHGCPVADLIRANNLHPDRVDKILVGQKLILPASCGGADPDGLPPAAPHYREVGVDQTTLPRLMRERGFRPPQKFKALVVEITFDPTRRHIVRERAFDWNGTSDDATDWNPASSIKLFAAIGALERIGREGFSSSATVTFHGRKRYTTTVAELVREAIIDSDNIAYNRLVQLASFDFLHGTVLTHERGFGRAALMGAYQKSTWVDTLGEDPSLRVSPAITLSERDREHTFEAARGTVETRCGNGACASLQDLAEATRRLMLQEQLPREEGFGLAQDDLLTLRRAMRAERKRGNEMVDAFAEVFDDDNVRFYSKPGFSKGWFSDNVYIYDPSENQAWIVTMAGYEGRNSLNDAARVVAEIIANGELRELP